MHVRRLDGKVLMVAGATRGIGLATAERLVAEGACVVLTARGEDGGREVEARLRGASADVMFVPADMTEVAGPVAVVETAVGRYGRLDGAFNNVGGVVAPGRPADIDAASSASARTSTAPPCPRQTRRGGSPARTRSLRSWPSCSATRRAS